MTKKQQQRLQLLRDNRLNAEADLIAKTIIQQTKKRNVLPATYPNRRARLEVCHKNAKGVFVRSYGTDLDWEIKDGQTDYTTMVLTRQNEIIVIFKPQDLVWARLEYTK